MSLLGAPETHPNDPSPIPREQEGDAFLLHSEPFPEALSHLTGRRLCLILLLGMACSFPLYSFFFSYFLKQYVPRMNTRLSLAGKKKKSMEGKCESSNPL